MATRSDLRTAIRSLLRDWPDQDILAAAITTTTATTLTCTDYTKYKTGQIIELDSEVMRIQSISTTTLTITRGYMGTTAATHVISSIIYIPILWPNYELNLVINQAIIWLRPEVWTADEISLLVAADVVAVDLSAEASLAAYTWNYPYGNRIMQIWQRPTSSSSDQRYCLFTNWQQYDTDIKFHNPITESMTMLLRIQAYQAELTADTTALTCDGEALEAIEYYAAGKLVKGLVLDRARFTDYSAIVSDRASTVQELMAAGRDLISQALQAKKRAQRPYVTYRPVPGTLKY